MIKNLTNKIILATIELGAKKGIESISIKDIGNKCKVSSAAMYYHFKNKYELLVESAFYIVKEITFDINKGIDMSMGCEEKYKRMMKIIAKYHMDNPVKSIFYTRMLVIPSMEISMKDSEKIASYCPLIQMLSMWQKTGEICNIPHIMSIAYYPLCIYLLHNFINKTEPEKGAINNIINNLWNMITVQNKAVPA